MDADLRQFLQWLKNIPHRFVQDGIKLKGRFHIPIGFLFLSSKADLRAIDIYFFICYLYIQLSFYLFRLYA